MTCSSLVYLLLLLQILVVQSVIQNVTRNKGGDIYLNPDKSCASNSCRSYKGIIIGGSIWLSDNCRCACNYDTTFVVHNTTCVYNSKVHSNLRASLPKRDASFYVTKDDNCMSSPTIIDMPILDITRSSKRILCLVGTQITNCNIIKDDSMYLYKGQWYPIWPANRKQDTFTITESDDIITLKWNTLGQQFAGLIFALRISCQLTMDDTDTFGSYLLFKSAGWHYFDGVKPTLTPVSSAPASKEPSSTQQPSTTTSPSNSGKGKNSGSSEDKGLIAGLTICFILILLVIIVAVVYYIRRKRNDENPKEEAKCEANPTYELGQDRSLPVTVNGQTPTYDYPDTSGGYQPLVQNTRMRDASGKVPVYTPLSRETKNNGSPVLQMKTPGKPGLAYETVAIPIQQPTIHESPELPESPEYEDPINPIIPDEGSLYAVSRPQDNNTMYFENIEYADPESVMKIG